MGFTKNKTRMNIVHIYQLNMSPILFSKFQVVFFQQTKLKSLITSQARLARKYSNTFTYYKKKKTSSK